MYGWQAKDSSEVRGDGMAGVEFDEGVIDGEASAARGRPRNQSVPPRRRHLCGECSESFNLVRNLNLHAAAQHLQEGSPLICPGEGSVYLLKSWSRGN